MAADNKKIAVRIVLVAIIAILLIYGVIFLPLARKWSQLEDRIQDLDVQYLRNLKTVGLFDESFAQYNLYEGDITQKSTDEEEIALFLKNVEELIRNKMMTIRDIKPLDVRDAVKVHTVLIEVEFEGSINNLVALLHELASSQTLTYVEKLSIAPISQVDNSLIFTVVFAKSFIR